jgi:hypothetical protein
VPEKTNIWRDCVDGYYDWVKEHIAEGAPLNEADHCGDPPLVLAAGNGTPHRPLDTKTRRDRRLSRVSPPKRCSVKQVTREPRGEDDRTTRKASDLTHQLNPTTRRDCGAGHLACVKLLVNEGADLQQCGLMKDTALTRAAHNGHMQVSCGGVFVIMPGCVGVQWRQVDFSQESWRRVGESFQRLNLGLHPPHG